MSSPDFFLSSSESSTFYSPRAAFRIKSLMLTNGGNEFLLIRIDPPVSGRDYGAGDNAIVEVLVSPKLKGYTINPISAWPLYVYVARPLVNLDDEVQLRRDQFYLMAWAALYQTEEDARAGVGRPWGNR